MVNYLDLVSANIVGNWLSNPGRDDEALRARAQNIQDNFGLKPADIADYRERTGGSGFLRGLAIGAVLTTVGGIFAISFGATALMVGAIAGLVALGISMAVQGAKVRNGYSNYLDTVATLGREDRERRITLNKSLEPYDNMPAKKSFVSEVTASREQIPATGTSR